MCDVCALGGDCRTYGKDASPAPVRGLDTLDFHAARREATGRHGIEWAVLEAALNTQLQARIAEATEGVRKEMRQNLGVCNGCPMEAGASADCVIGACESPFGKEQTRHAALRALHREWVAAREAVAANAFCSRQRLEIAESALSAYTGEDK